MTPCDYAYLDATQGKFVEAETVFQKNRCRNVTFVATRQYATDPSGAERLLRANADKQELVGGFGDLSKAAAEKGNISEALRFLAEAERLGGPNTVIFDVQLVARAWTIRDGPKAVLKWARSRPTIDQRTRALIGMAEALGHARPTARCVRYPPAA